jgi:hypothetical protein
MGGQIIDATIVSAPKQRNSVTRTFGESAPNRSGKDLRLAPHPIEESGPNQHAEAAAGIGERRRVPPGIIGLR